MTRDIVITFVLVFVVGMMLGYSICLEICSDSVSCKLYDSLTPEQIQSHEEGYSQMEEVYASSERNESPLH